MVNEGIITYLFVRVGVVLFWPVVIFAAVLLFNPITWLIIGVIWLLSNAYKGVEAQVAEEDAQARAAESDAPSATSN